MTTLLIADHENTTLSDQTSKALTAALALGGDVDVLVAGEGARPAADAAARLTGVAKVILAEGPGLAHRLAEPFAELVVKLAAGYEAIVVPSTTTTRNVLPRVAAMLDVMQVSDVVAIHGPDSFDRPIYAGNAIQTVRSKDRIKVLTVRTTAFPAAAQGGSATVEAIEADAVQTSRFVDERLQESERPELMSAKVVVSGGRALGSREKFDEVMLPLADKLGAAIGASRAAVDAGYAPNDWQVGQTGKVVAPKLYVACGISGAIQHLAGMKDSKVIVAINKDEEAPIFQVADYGLVGDIFEVLPELTEKL